LVDGALRYESWKDKQGNNKGKHAIGITSAMVIGKYEEVPISTYKNSTRNDEQKFAYKDELPF